MAGKINFSPGAKISKIGAKIATLQEEKKMTLKKRFFFQKSSTYKAKIENMHYTICLELTSSSGQIALPPAFARLEQRGVLLISRKIWLKSCGKLFNLVCFFDKSKVVLRKSNPKTKHEQCFILP